MASNFQSALFKAKKKRRPGPVNPPPGTYDPAIDAQGRTNQRSYDDMLQDFGRGKTRSADDLAIALGQTGTAQKNNLADLTQSRDRNLADLLTGRTRLGQDHATALNDLGRHYSQLAGVQAEGARHNNVESAGILAQALAARTANQAHDQAPIDTSYQRALADSTTAEQRLGQDYTTGVDRTNQAASTNSDAMKLAFDRLYGKGGDNVVNLARSGRDLVANRLDLSSQKWYQAAANGYSPVAPKRRKQRRVIL